MHTSSVALKCHEVLVTLVMHAYLQRQDLRNIVPAHSKLCNHQVLLPLPCACAFHVLLCLVLSTGYDKQRASLNHTYGTGRGL